MSPAPSPGATGLRRRTRLYLIGGIVISMVAAAAILLLRPRPEPYSPGAELERGEEITRSLARELPDDAPGLRFVDVAADAGIRFRHFPGTRSTQLPEDMGSGAAWGDYDGDGDPDLFLVNESGPLENAGNGAPSPPGRSALYRNEGNGRFIEIAEAAGVAAAGIGMGAAWGDVDGDRDLDLVVTRYGTNLLYRNEGDGSFTDLSTASGIGGLEGFWTGASFADFDRDGDLDLYICGYVRYRYDASSAGDANLQFETVVPYSLNPSSYPPERNLLFRNDGGSFTEVAEAAGVANASGRSLSASWADFDLDGWPDLYVANDISDNVMFHSLGDGRFADVSHSAWVADYRGAMGLAIGDWNNDGDFDIFVTHWIAQENALYDNQAGTIAVRPGEPMHFVDKADMTGLGQIALDDIGWGTGFADFDNDGRLDLFVVNGSTFQRADDPSLLVPMRDRLFWNGGEKRGFYDIGPAAGDPFTGTAVGRGAAFADYDDDGDLDVAIVNHGGPAQLLRNDGGAERNWLRVVVRGPEPGSRDRGPSERATTSFAIGTLLRLTAAGETQMRQVGSSSSYLSQSPPGEAWFGLGETAVVDRLELTWPDGSTEVLDALPVNGTLRVTPGRPPAFTAGRRPEQPREQVRAFWESFREATKLRLGGTCAAAIAAYERALSLDPMHGDTLYYLGQCRREIGRLEAAQQAFTRLIGFDPDSARGHMALGVLYAGNGSRPAADLDAAEHHLRAAQALNAEETGSLVRLGEIRLLRGDRAAARTLFTDALRTNPKSVESAFLLGYLAWEAGDLAGARRYCRAAIEAGRRERPIEGVLGEGDTGVNDAAGTTSSGDQTLFGRFTSVLATQDRSAPNDEMSEAGIARLYEPVRDFVRGAAGAAAPDR